MKKRLIWMVVGSLAIFALGAGLIVSFAGDDAKSRGEYRRISFSTLSSFPYSPPGRRLAGDPAPERSDPFPAAVRALDGVKVSITGYMVPVSMKAGHIDGFYLSRGGSLGCCYGDMPKMSDYIKVTMAPGLYAPNLDLAHVNGVLEVGEELDVAGYVATLYRLHADLVLPAEREGPAWGNVLIWVVAYLLCVAVVGPVERILMRTRPKPGTASDSSER